MKKQFNLKRNVTVLIVSFMLFMFSTIHSYGQNDPVCNQLIESTKSFFNNLKEKKLNIAELDKLTHDEAVIILGNGTIHEPPASSGGKRDFSGFKGKDRQVIVNEVTINNIYAKKLDDKVVSVYGEADIQGTLKGISGKATSTFSFIYLLKADGTWQIV